MIDLYNIKTHKDSPSKVWGVVEIAKDSNVKYEYHPDLETFIYDRSLLSAMVYPASYGFIPKTLADDGDALDILIYNACPIQRGTLVECEVVGVMDMIDDGDLDYKILGVPVSHIKKINNIDQIDPAFLKVTQNFFSHYKELTGQKVQVGEWHDKEVAKEIIKSNYR